METKKQDKKYSTTGLDLYYRSLNNGKTPLKEIKHKAASEVAGVPMGLLKKQNPGFFHQLLDILDRPGNATRALLVGKLGGLKGLIPFGQTIEDLTGVNVGLDEQDRVAGTEVVDKLFGKQANTPGKLDVGDVLGFLVEVAADPLWLTGAAAVTKLGKAAKVAESALKGAEATLKAGTAAPEFMRSAQIIKDAVEAAKAGQAIPSTVSGHFKTALETLKANKAMPVMGKTLAEQARLGQRGLLNIAGKPVIKGEKIFEGLDKIGDAYKLSPLGHAFRAVGKRVEGKYSDVYNDITDAANAAATQGRIHTQILEQLAKDYPDIDREVLSKFVEAEGAQRTGERILADLQAKGASPAEQQKVIDSMTKMQGELAQIRSKIAPNKVMDYRDASARLTKLQDDILAYEQKAGVPIGNVDDVIGYVSRQMTPEANEWFRKNSPTIPSMAERMQKVLSTSTKHRGELGGATRGEVEQIFQQYGYKGKSPIFEPDAFKATARRIQMGSKVAGHAEGVKAVLEKYAQPIPETGVPMDYWQVGKVQGNEGNIFGVTGLDQYKDMMLPRSIARELKDATSHASSEELMNKFWKAVDTGQSWWKGGMTVYWPAYHARNALSNINLQALSREGADALNPLSYFKTTAKLPTGQVLSKQELQKLGVEHGLLKQSLGELGQNEIKGKFFEPGRKIGGAIEDRALLAEFANRLEKGYAPADAAREVKDAMINYGDISPFEQKWAKRAIPFYTFSRKNLPIQTKALLQQPGKQALLAHATTGTPEMGQDQEIYPNWWRERLVGKLPWKNKNGKDLVIAGTGLPIEDAFGNFAGASNDGPWGVINRLATRQFSRMSPFIKTPVEFLTGKDTYYGKDITETPYAPKWARLLPETAAKALTIEKIENKGKPDRYIMNPRVSWAMRQTPLARASTSAEMIADTGEPTTANIVGLTTGFKPRTYDKERQTKLALAEVAKQELDQQVARGKIYKFNKYYKPKGIDIDEDKAKEIEMLLKAQ